MNSKSIIIITLVVAVGAGVIVVGDDLLPQDSSSDAEPFPTETPQATATSTAQGGADGDGTSTASSSSSLPPFAFVIENIEECGTTCREVTTTLRNQQDTTAADITVYSRIFAGQGTDGEQIWRGEASVGTLEAGEAYTATRRVELSFQEGLAVQNEDGWITIQTTVETANQTFTFTQQRQVL